MFLKQRNARSRHQRSGRAEINQTVGRFGEPSEKFIGHSADSANSTADCRDGGRGGGLADPDRLPGCRGQRAFRHAARTMATGATFAKTRRWRQRLDGLHLRERSAESGEDEPDEAFHAREIDNRESRHGNFYCRAVLGDICARNRGAAGLKGRLVLAALARSENRR